MKDKSTRKDYPKIKEKRIRANYNDHLRLIPCLGVKYLPT